MSHTIQLPDAVYQAIAAYAAKRGQTPEEAIEAWAEGIPESAEVATAPSAPEAEGIERLENPAYDPWAGFRGITTALSPDSIERHDAYIAEELPKRHESTE